MNLTLGDRCFSVNMAVDVSATLFLQHIFKRLKKAYLQYALTSSPSQSPSSTSTSVPAGSLQLFNLAWQDGSLGDKRPRINHGALEEMEKSLSHVLFFKLSLAHLGTYSNGIQAKVFPGGLHPTMVCTKWNR